MDNAYLSKSSISIFDLNKYILNKMHIYLQNICHSHYIQLEQLTLNELIQEVTDANTSLIAIHMYYYNNQCIVVASAYHIEDISSILYYTFINVYSSDIKRLDINLSDEYTTSIMTTDIIEHLYLHIGQLLKSNVIRHYIYICGKCVIDIAICKEQLADIQQTSINQIDIYHVDYMSRLYTQQFTSLYKLKDILYKFKISSFEQIQQDLFLEFI